MTQDTSTTNSRTITAFYDQRAQAEAAVTRLASAGIDRANINVRAGSGNSGTVATTGHDEQGLWESLKDMFLPDEDRSTYTEGLRRGGFLVTAKISGDQYAKALDILDDEGTVDLDQRAESWRQEGWSGYKGANVSTPVRAAESSVRTGAVSPVAGATAGRTAASADQIAEGRDAVIPIAEEQLRVGKREVDHGRVRVRSYIVETPVEEKVGLREEHVHVERRAVDRPATAADGLFQDRTIEATEMAEEAVISKEARVKEELVLRKDAEQRTQNVSDKVRHTEVEVEDERGNTTRTGSTAVPERKIS